MIKKLSILGIGALAIMSACNSKPKTEYTINGTTDLADGEVVYLYHVVGDSMVTDSCVVANGAFTFNGNAEKPGSGRIAAGAFSYSNSRMRAIILEPGDMEIALTGDDYTAAEVKGSPLTEQMDSLDVIKSEAYNKIRSLRKAYMEAQGDTVKMAEIDKEYTEVNEQLQKAQLDFIKNHPTSYYSVMVLNSIKSNLSLDEIKELYNGLAPEVQAADETTAKYIAALESIAPGAQAPEIKGMDQNGNEVSLSGLKGKVVLVDFWATWCGPCRASLPHVKELYEKYHDKGFEVLAISLDHSEEPWKEFIANGGMGMENYVNIYDAPYKNADNYAIQYIPSKFIVDAEGTMIGRFDDEAELDAKLAELFQ